MAAEYHIGIDLGTTYSCLQYIDDDGNPVIEKNFEQEDTTPSVILFNENGEIIVGSPAKEMATLYPPNRLISSIKRQMGTNYEVNIDGEKYNPIMLSAMILKKIINDFNENHRCNIKRAVITCPAYFGQKERDATKTAGVIAGLDNVTIINEPTAAAIYFGSENIPSTNNKILVYDLGGGTFDVTILEINGNSFTALATDGERLLGGKDWDSVIARIIKDKISQENDIDIETLDEDDDVNQILVGISETIKKRLSTSESTKGTLTVDGKKMIFTITRSEFESASAGLIQTTIEIIDRALLSKGLSISDICKIILVGGSSRMPQVKNAIISKYPGIDINILDPDQSIAKGAAIFSRSNSIKNLKPKNNTEKILNVHNVLSKTFGIKVMCEDGTEMISNIIFKNETLPIESVRVYYPVEDKQSKIKIEIYENASINNENGKRSVIVDSIPIGEFMMDLPMNATRNTPVKVKFVATDEGILIASIDCMDYHNDYKIENDLQMSTEDVARSQGLMERVSKP